MYQQQIDMGTKRISELEGDIVKLKQPPGSKVSKNLLGELTRESNNSDNKIKQIVEEIRTSKEKKNKVELKARADLEEALQS